MWKALIKIDKERPYFKIIKAIQKKKKKKLTGNIIPKGENLKPSLIKSGTRKGGQLSSLLFDILAELGAPTTTVR